MTRKSGIEQRATTERGQDVTTAGQAVTRRGQDITLLGQGGKTQKDYQDYIDGLKKDANTFLGKVLTSPSDYGIDTDTGEVFEPKALTGWQNVFRGKKFKGTVESYNKAGQEVVAGKVSPQSIRALMTQINTVADKARKGKLTPEEEEFLLNIQNIEGSLGGGQIAPQPMAETPSMPTTEPMVAPVETGVEDILVKFNEVVSILVKSGIGFEEATMRTLQRPEFASLREPR